MIRHFVNLFLAWLPPTRLFALRWRLLRWAGIDAMPGVKFSGRGWIYGRGRLRIGEDTWFSPGATLYTNEAAEIRIGARCDIGPDVTFVTGTHEVGPADRRAGEGRALAIDIGDGCWIGARSVVLGGVILGSGCIVAAGSVVTRSVPANSLVAGVPAQIKRELP